MQPLLDSMNFQEGRKILLEQPQFQVPFLLDYLAVFLWAMSGAIVGMHKRYDFAGVLVVALLASTGGSLIRDGIFLQQTPPVLSNPLYIPVIITATMFVSLFRRRITKMVLVDRVVDVIDGIGVPAFAIIGLQLSLQAGIPLPGVVVVGVNVDESGPAVVPRFRERFGIQYPLVYDVGSTWSTRYGVEGLPTLVVIDRQGNIRHRHAGVESESDLQSVVESLL